MEEFTTTELWNITDIIINNDYLILTTTEENNVENIIGPRRDGLYIVLPITIIYLSIFLTGMIGNISTCIVIARNKSMHTATNYYLFSLAISDLLLLIAGLPVEIYSVWSKYPYIFGEYFCILRGLFAECSTYASVLTITAFTVERYVAICHPFLSHTMSKLSRAIKLILIIWFVALCFSIPQALQFGIVQHKQIHPDFIICTLKTIFIKHSFEFSTFLFFLVPMTVITVLYIMIGLKLRKSNMMKKKNHVRSQRGGGSNNRKKLKRENRYRGRSSRRVLKMLVCICIAFFICWCPFHIQRLIAIHGTRNDHVTSKNSWIEYLYIIFTYISGVLYYFSTTINPILYNIMSNKFREAFMETLARSCGNKTSSDVPQEQRSYSSLSRSHQKTPGIFGSRTVGTGGTGVAPESSDCSVNSNHEDSPRQSTSAACQSSLGINNEIKKTNIKNGIKNNSSKKLINKNNDIMIKIEGNIEKTVINCDDNINNKSSKYKINNQSSQITGDNDKQNGVVKFLTLGLTSVGNDSTSNNKKWWRFIKWLPTPKAFKLTSRSTTFDDNNTIDIQSNREEYSMASRYFPNDHDHRFV